MLWGADQSKYRACPLVDAIEVYLQFTRVCFKSVNLQYGLGLRAEEEDPMFYFQKQYKTYKCGSSVVFYKREVPP